MNIIKLVKKMPKEVIVLNEKAFYFSGKYYVVNDFQNKKDLLNFVWGRYEKV